MKYANEMKENLYNNLFVMARDEDKNLKISSLEDIDTERHDNHSKFLALNLI